MQDSTEDVEKTQESASEADGFAADEALQDALEQQADAWLEEQGITSAITSIEAEGFNPQDVKQFVVDELSQDPAYQQASYDLQEYVQELTTQADQVTVGQIAAEVTLKATQMLATLFVDNAGKIFSLAVAGAASALSNDQVRDLVLGKASEVISDLVIKFGSSQLTGHDPKTLSALSYLGSIVTESAGKQAWDEIVFSTVLTVSTLSPLLETGFNVLGVVGLAVNNIGWLTSNGAPLKFTTYELNGSVYYGTSVNGLTILVDSNPTLARRPIIVSMAKDIPTWVTKALKAIKWIPGPLTSIARTIINAINSESSKAEAIKQATAPYLKDWVVHVGNMSIQDMASAIYDYVLSRRQPPVPPSTPSTGGDSIKDEQVVPDEPTFPNVSQLDASLKEITDGVADAKNAQVESRPGSSYPYLIEGSLESLKGEEYIKRRF